MSEHDPNPLRSRAQRIDFRSVTAQDVEAGIDAAVAEAEAALARLLAAQGPRRYADTVDALDALLERVDRVYGYAYHLTSVRSTPELREAFARVQPRYKAFRTRLDVDPRLYSALQSVATGAEAHALDPLRRRHLDKTLERLRRAGASLGDAERERVTELRVELARLGTRFSEHVLDATNAFALDVDDRDDLDGLPETVVEQARERARAAGKDGWRVTLHAPSYVPFLRHARRRDLRERLWRAYNGRAEGGPFDNRAIVADILRLRRELARHLGYRDYAELALEDRMLAGVDQVRSFLRTLEDRTRPYAEREVGELETFARETLGIDTLEPWDVRFAFERWREHRFDLDEQALRPYFPLPHVQTAMFELASDLFGLRFEEVDAPERWHDDVSCFEVRNEAGTHVGTFYTDWFPRADKRDGAWMNDLIEGGPIPGGGFEPHVGLMCGNLTPSGGGRPALLDFQEVQTLFHEFGHLLHLLVTNVEVRARGMGAVAWDFIELPSQVMENWTLEPAALARFARHVDSGEPIPEGLVAKLLAARHFMQPWSQMRQLALASVDMALHVDFDPDGDTDALEFARDVMVPFDIAERFVASGFVCAFSHIMAGSYASGYYAYKWSEVLDADAFSRFREEGLFDRDVGRAFVDTLLARGDSADPGELFEAFMGRGPRIDAVIERNLGPLPVQAD
jgi:oligopeptidase A